MGPNDGRSRIPPNNEPSTPTYEELLARVAQLERELQNQRKRAEKALREASERFQAILDRAPVAIYVKDRDGRFVFGNRALERFTGRTVAAIIGTTDYDWSPVEDADCWREHDLKVLESGRVWEFEETGTTGEGRPYVNLSTKFPLTDESGTPVAVCGISTDITERKRAEARVVQSQRTFIDLVECAPFGIYIVDSRFRIAHMNAGSQAGAFRNVRPVIGRDFSEAMRILWPEHVAVEIIAAFRHTLDTGEPYYSPRFFNPRHDVEAVEGYEWELHRMTLPDGQHGVVCYYFDSTKLREAEQSLREADRRKDEFIALLSHELRNPLAPIRFALPVLQGASPSDSVRRAVGVVERQVAHLTRLVDDLLDVSRFTTGRLELRRDYVALATVVKTAVEAAAPAVAAGQHSLQVVAPDEPIWVHGDATRLSQITTNLLDNAAKYTPPGGRLELAVERQGQEGIIRVRDNGIGIPPESLETVFEMFHQVDWPDKVQGGLGIGLGLVKRLVEMHGGRIEAQSAGIGQGAEFTVRLPLASEIEQEPVGGTDTPPLGTGRLKVLVVDDNADLVEMLAFVVESFGHDVQKASDGASALSAAAFFRPDVVLLDLGLPDMAGVEVARELRRRAETATSHLVALTGWGTDEDRRQTQSAGFDRHLTKPADPETLRRLLTQVSDGLSKERGQ